MTTELTSEALEFYTTDEAADVSHGSYWIYKGDRDWIVRYWPLDRRLHKDDPIEIVALGEDESGAEALIDWPTNGCAREIAGAHSKLVRSGHTPESAASLILELSREYLREKAAMTVLVERGVAQACDSLSFAR